MDIEPLGDYCTVTECWSVEDGWEDVARDDHRLSVIVFFDQPFDTVALDEALFNLAIQDHEHLEVILVLPDCGRAFHQQAERAVRAQPWPSPTRALVVSVGVRVSEMISANLLNAGVLHATGRYVAFLHHQDLVYQHAYKALIERLLSTEAVVAFGGVRVAAHARANRHWMVTSKSKPNMNAPRLSVFLNGRAALHALVMDRSRIPSDYLFAHNPASRLAVTMFLSRLALHEKADFTLFGEKIVESRTPPHLSAASTAGLGRLPSAEAVRASLLGDGFSLRPDALSIPHLLADALAAHALETGSAAS